ncbi:MULTISPECIES: hypothetical protein [Pseudoalteromonas]|uniref:hypothetical protein n=1 Tax=Pseudoalteromonas TaxID=53246 RepID=UPI0015829CE9|nr:MULTISPECIES: hypothetical protein [Pseudoalteromonas]MDI4652080.1 hypothetical protein [Pseudoalteromonas shioyasakiensis]NUJ38405.1 hypothetical protein [Pseudoalteromonas sp. 0303]
MNKLKRLIRQLSEVLIQRAIHSFVIVFRERPFLINSVENTTEPTKKEKSLLLILGCKNYSEVTESYHLKSLVDLHKILRLEQQSSDTPFLYRISDYKDNQRQVTKAFIKEDVLPYLPKAKILYPESWLISEQIKKDLVMVENDKTRYIFFPSEYEHTVLALSGLLQTKDDIYASAGVSSNVKVINKDLRWLNNNLISFTLIKGLLGPKVVGLFAPKQLFGEQIKINWKLPLFTVVLVFSVYLIGVQAYLELSLRDHQQKTVQLNEQLNPLFDQLNRNQEGKELVKTLSSFDNRTGWGVSVWVVLKPFLDENIDILSFNLLESEKVTIRARTSGKAASEILADLLEIKSVSSAQFVGNVYKRNNVEDFTVSIEMTNAK